MSAALRKRNHRLEDVPHLGFISTVLPASILILLLATLVVILGHFTPAG